MKTVCCSDDDNFDLPLIYHVNCHSLHFGRREFCLLTSFEFGSISFCEYRNGDIPFRNRLFPEKIGYDVKIIDLFALFDDEEKFSKLSDADAIRLCLLLSLEVIFMGRELVSVVDDVYLRMVNDLDAWNSFPWGEHIWRQLYDSIRNVSSKHKLEHLAGLKRNPNHVLSYSLTGFLFAFKIWIIESSCVSDRWWTKVPEIIPRALSWRRKAEFNQYEYFGELFRKAPIELAPTKDEVQCNWYAPSNDYFMWYVPRSPPVSIGGLYGEYLNKRSAARAAKKKSSEDFHPSECVREASLIDRVRDLECICETLLTLPKEVKSLRGRIHKLESIIQSTFYPSRVVEKQETLKKVVPQIEDYLQSTSEDEPDIKDHTSPKEDDGNVYYCDDNGDVPLFFMPAKPSEIQRLYKHREARLNKIAEEDKQRKCLGHMNLFAHMKLAIERCVPKKRKYVDVLRSPFCVLPKISNVPSIEQLANQKNVLNPLMIEKCKSVKPWIEDLSRPFKRIDKNFLSHELQNGLCALDDNRKGWLLDEHIDLWATYLWLTRQTDMDWAMVSMKELKVGNIVSAKCKISFKVAVVFPTGWGVLRSTMLANGIPLALDDPLQSALAYREKLIHFYFKHKMFCP
ncbi:phospholipase-like protein [Tanacetum coccineum]